jgi:hypothetical protein
MVRLGAAKNITRPRALTRLLQFGRFLTEKCAKTPVNARVETR